MTVTSTTAISGPYDGNDVTVTFDYTFYIADEDELKVTLTDEDGVDTVQTITTHYTVTISDDGTGTFTMVTPPATGEKVTATLDVDLTQETDLLNLGQFSAETHEDMSDKLTRICQQQQEVLDRCLKLGQSSDLDPDDVTLANLAGQVIISTTNFANVLTSADDTLQEALETLDGGFAARVPKLLDTATASASANLSVTSSSASSYDRLMLEFVGIRPATDDVGLYLRVSSNLGVAWYTGATDYAWLSAIDDNTTHGNVVYDASDNQLYLIPTTYGIGNQTYEVARGCLYIEGHNGSTNTDFPRVHGNISYCSPSTAHYLTRVSGRIVQLEDMNGFQIAMSSGNITSGTLRLWGLPTGS